jgi:hypothetical protein
MEAPNRPEPDILNRLRGEILALKELDTDGLRATWTRLFRRPAPPHLPKYLLFRVLAYRVQANALGDLDRESVRYLERVAKDNEARGIRPGHKRSKAFPRVPPVPDRRSLKPGTILVREHDGVLHRVIAMEKGFAWNGDKYRSLSEVAQAITGTNWNGPRFFGLRQKSRRASSPDAGRGRGA